MIRSLKEEPLEGNQLPNLGQPEHQNKMIRVLNYNLLNKLVTHKSVLILLNKEEGKTFAYNKMPITKYS